MSSAKPRTLLNDCGCCEGQTASTPKRIENRSGLSTIAYRAGDYYSFKESMLAKLSSSDLPVLSGLSTRDQDDYSIALIDAWASVSDVLCFYQEYFANEGFLRTAKERLSVLEHARLIGYQLNPGVAASAYLAFTMDKPIAGTDNPVLETTIPEGAQVQSTPGPDETAQLFETEIAIQARVDWNAMRPRMTQPQVIDASMQSVVIDGLTTFVKPGDELLLINASGFKYIRKVTSLVVDDVTQTTQLKISGDNVSPSGYSIDPKDIEGIFSGFDGKVDVDDAVINSFINHSWAMGDIIAIIDSKHWDLDEIAQRINTHEDVTKKIGAGEGVYGFHKRANLFGYNAQKRVTYKTDGSGLPEDISKWAEWNSNETPGEMFLDNAYTEILPESYIVLNGRVITASTPASLIASAEFSDEEIEPGNISPFFGGYFYIKPHSVYKIDEVKSLTRTAYGISGKSTQLFLENGESWRTILQSEISIIRKAEVLVQSEALALTQVPLDEKVSGDRILLERADFYLRNLQYVSISG